MAIDPAYANSLVGQWVDCHTPYGVRSGILREVRSDGIVLEMPPSATYANGKKDIHFEGETTDFQAENVFFRPFFRFFIPFFLLLALTRRRFI